MCECVSVCVFVCLSERVCASVSTCAKVIPAVWRVEGVERVPPNIVHPHQAAGRTLPRVEIAAVADSAAG